MAKTLAEYQKAIEASLQDISKITYNAELLAAQQARVQLELRTFATGGTGVKDVSGKNLSNYSKAYAKRREKAGLQIANKDLEFNKNSSSIRHNLDVGISDGGPAFGHIKENGYRIAGYQEEREGVNIFKLNDQEINNIRKTVKDSVMEAIRKLAEGWNK